MQQMPPPRPNKLRFGLRALILLTTAIACLIGIGRVSLGALVLILAIAAWLVLLRGAQRGARSPLRAGRRHSLRTRRFWRTFWVTLPFAAGLNLLTYWQTYGATQFDGCEMIGWPAPFLARCGGNSMFEWYAAFDRSDLIADLVTPLGISIVAGIALCGGARRLRIRIAGFLSGRA